MSCATMSQSAVSASRRRGAIESINQGGARITQVFPANLTSGGTKFAHKCFAHQHGGALHADRPITVSASALS